MIFCHSSHDEVLSKNDFVHLKDNWLAKEVVASLCFFPYSLRYRFMIITEASYSIFAFAKVLTISHST